LELRRNWRAAEFGKGLLYSNLPATAQEGTKPLKEAAGVLVFLDLHQLPQHGIGFVREEFGVGFQDAAGFLPGLSPNK
jgi:hypothetical protein